MDEGSVVRSSGTNDSTSPAVDAVPTGEQRPGRGAVTFVDNAVSPTRW